MHFPDTGIPPPMHRISLAGVDIRPKVYDANHPVTYQAL